jgi:hypothetical protein
MNSHDRAQQLISARMDAPLTAAEHRELNAHLASCDACRVFVANADDLARELHALPRLAPSPAVSRAVMTAISTENDGWGWLRNALQALSSPGMAVASGLALVAALAGAMFLAMNAPGDGEGDGIAANPDATLAAMADEPVPTKIPTETPAPEPTATTPRTITESNRATNPPAETPTPRPTQTRTPSVARAQPTVTPAIQQAVIESPPIEPGEGPVGGGDPTLAMATEAESAPVESSADLAQAAEQVQTGEEVSQPEAAPEVIAEEPAPEAAPADNGGNGRRDGGRRGGDQQAAPEEAAAPVATEAVPVPDEAIAALESAGESPNSVVLPPAPILPMPPEQAFLPITPTPVTESTPSPETDAPADAPQLAEVPSGDLGVTALAPAAPSEDAVVSEPDVTVIEDERVREKEKKDKSAQDGKSHENQQRAYDNSAMGWSMAPMETLLQEVVLPQTADDGVAAATDSAAATTPEPAPQIDPATGLEIDPTTGLLIEPTTGYLFDPATGLFYDRRTGFQVHPYTGLLIDPVTGAQLDPVTLAVVIPAGFGSDTPTYSPGDPAMRGQIETVVDDNYDNATYKVIPGTDGPVQPVDEIIVPTESGEAVEIQ